MVLLGLTLKGFGQNELMNLEIKYEAAKRAFNNKKWLFYKYIKEYL